MEAKDKLIVEFWQMENVVNMKVLNQPDVIDRGQGIVLRLPGICIMSGDYPYININSTLDQLYIMGRDKEFDNKIACYSFMNDYQASQFISKAVLAISTLNFILENKAEFCVDILSNGTRDCVAGVNSDEWREFKKSTYVTDPDRHGGNHDEC